MTHPSDSSSPGRDSDSGFEFIPPPSNGEKKSLPAPPPIRSTPQKANAQSKRTPQRATSRAKNRIRIQEREENPQSVAQRLRRKRSQLSSFFTSTILHSAIVIVLALWAMDRETEKPEIGLLGRLDMNETADEDVIETSPIKFESSEVADSPVESVAEDTSDDVEELAASEVPTLVAALPADAPSADAVEAVAVAPAKTLPTGGGLAGRDADSRAKLASKFGGSPGSESAVEEGLRWIIKHQLSDGSWTFRHECTHCDGRCGNEGRVDDPNAATGMALMAILGAGYTHERGPYQGEVRQGLAYLSKEIRYLPYGGSLKGISSKALYSHALATIALAEAYAMTGDEEYRKPVEEAYRFIVASQHPKGGWKYRDRSPGDMSVTGWMVMAMKACENAGVEPNEKAQRLAKQFVDSLAYGGGIEYGYEMSSRGDIKPANPERKPSCTAIGHLLEMYFGREQEHPLLANGCQFLAETGSSKSDVYFNYYGTLALHHARAPQWKRWNQTVRDELVATQQREGHEAGSWFFPDQHGSVGGRLYTTAMAIMTLEVYYRFMPLYETREGKTANSDSVDSVDSEVRGLRIN